MEIPNTTIPLSICTIYSLYVAFVNTQNQIEPSESEFSDLSSSNSILLSLVRAHSNNLTPNLQPSGQYDCCEKFGRLGF